MTGKAATKKDSLLHLVDSDGSGTIDAHEFAVLYDAIKRDLEEDLEKQAALEKEASSATRKFKMLMLFVAVLVSFLAASVAANFAVLFTFVDSAITTATTSSGLLQAKGSDAIIKTAVATQDVPLMVAPALDIDTLSEVKSLKVVYRTVVGERVEARLTVVGVRKHNSTFVEFVTSVGGETVEALNGVASLVRYPTSANRLTTPIKHAICSANATCSAFTTSGIDAAAALDMARAELEKSGFGHAARRLAPTVVEADCSTGWWSWSACGVFGGLLCPVGSVMNALAYYYSGYSWFATRHVVFFLHGWTSNAAHMWMMYCTFGVLWCPVLELPQFRHLVFVFPTSFINGYLDGDTVDGVDIDGGWGLAWGDDLHNSLRFEQGADALAMLMCGNANAFELEWCWGLGWLSLFGVDSSSEVMLIGFSNGGGMATYGNWAYGKTITKSVAIDYHAHTDYDVWMPAVFAVSGAVGLNLKLYEACESWTFSTDGITTTGLSFGSGGQTFSATQATKLYGGFGFGYLPYKEFAFKNVFDGRKFVWAVHGYNAADKCTMNRMCMGCGKDMVHLAVPYFVGIIGDVLEWLDGSSAPSAPLPGGKPTAAPAPPPFPPASTWFLGIKPASGVGYGSPFSATQSSFDQRLSTNWQMTLSRILGNNWVARKYTRYAELCVSSDMRRRKLRGMIEDPRMVKLQKHVEPFPVEATKAFEEDMISLTKEEYAKEMKYLGMKDVHLTFSSIYDHEFDRAKEMGYMVEKVDPKTMEKYYDPKYRTTNAMDLMARAEELAAMGREAEAQALLLGPPSGPSPPPPQILEELLANGIMIERLCTSGRRCDGVVEVETCDGSLEVFSKDKEAFETGGTKGKSLRALLEAQLGPKGVFELFDLKSWDHGNQLRFMEGSSCASKETSSAYTWGCVSTDDFATQKEYMSEQKTLGDEMSAPLANAVHNIKKAVDVAGKPVYTLFAPGLACFSQSTTACRLLRPAAAPDAFAACFSRGVTSDVAERVPMDALVAGDTVLADEAALTRVVVNQHAGVKAAAPVLTLHFKGGSLSLTADHVLLLDGVPSAARLAAVGSVLSSGRKVSAVTHGSQAVVNPITAAGTILAADASGEPVVAATANEWLADVLLSAYPKYTVSFNLAALFPASVQAFYDAALEPFFALAVPRLERVKAAAPSTAVAAGLALGDALLAAGFLAFAVGKLTLVAAVAMAASRFVVSPKA